MLLEGLSKDKNADNNSDDDGQLMIALVLWHSCLPGQYGLRLNTSVGSSLSLLEPLSYTPTMYL